MDILTQVIFDNRFRFVADLTGDGVFTISDVSAWFRWVFFAPGDFVLLHLVNTGFGDFFEVSAQWMNGWVSGIFSFFAWVFVLLLAASLDGGHGEH